MKNLIELEKQLKKDLIAIRNGGAITPTLFKIVSFFKKERKDVLDKVFEGLDEYFENLIFVNSPSGTKDRIKKKLKKGMEEERPFAKIAKILKRKKLK